MYILDSNVFIEAKNRYYGFDIVPGFWEFLTLQHNLGQVCSISKVRAELIVGDDELSAWARENEYFFSDMVSSQTVACMRNLAEWANRESHYTAQAVNEFSTEQADFQLVARAMESSATIVTHEISSPRKRNRVKIPDAARAMGVEVVNTFDMLRNLGMRLRMG